jgi:hypothetical protein
MVVITVTILTVIGNRYRSEVTISIVPDRTSRSEAPLIKSSNVTLPSRARRLRVATALPLARAGLDLTKSIFQVHGVDDAGQAVIRLRLARSQLLDFQQTASLHDSHGGALERIGLLEWLFAE